MKGVLFYHLLISKRLFQGGQNKNMEVNVLMPQLGQSMTEGTVVEWLKKEGEHVDKMEALFVVDTQKSTIEVEADVAGTLKKILTQEQQQAKVGDVIAIIESEG
jgi:pyruvate/2-oxoglutarate dehydrogenase complex dihydrolipoamide acyltransferase (E2) component